MNTPPLYAQSGVTTAVPTLRQGSLGQASLGHGSLDRAADDRQTIERRAVEFEGLYLAEMLKPMFETLNSDETFGGGFGEDCWRSMQVQQYGKAIAEQGGIGLARAVAGELLRVQEARGGSVQ